ncbi:MAG: helix-turn-helix domain-containing protein [Ktedonobacteraceae bacterium]|nr:helix-turn-helix domain-containing protein [Ktedonobacteraceae bacterium]
MEKHPSDHPLKRAREQRNWSQKVLAEKLKIDTKTINRWENGKSIPRAYHRTMLSELFEQSVEELGFRPKTQEDCREMPHVEMFHGRSVEYAQLEQSITEGQCQLAVVLGMGGVGKTALASRLTEQVKDSFEYIFWRTLQNAPPLEPILRECIRFLSDQQMVDLPQATVDAQLLVLIQLLRERRCLLVLDNLESIMQAEQRAGQYQEGYENYGRLIQRIGEAQHRSCLLLTSREKPREAARLENTGPAVRSFHLSGLEQSAGRAVLEAKNLAGSDDDWERLIRIYSGNPLALKLISEPIQELFGGEIASFLRQKEIIFGDINELLDGQFHRLSAQEREILYWLAIERETVSLEEIRANLVRPVANHPLLEALDSLRRRSMIEVPASARFTLQPVIMEYVTQALVRQFCAEYTGESRVTWMNYTLIKAQAKDYVRDSQVRLILKPVADQLVAEAGRKGLEQRMSAMLAGLRQEHSMHPGYMAGNALNLLVHLRSDLQNADFTHLTIRQAYLQNATLPNVNFAHAHFIDGAFTATFGNILSVTFNSSGDTLAVGTTAGDIWLYEAASSTPYRSYHGHTDGAWSVVFSPDGTMLASGSDDQTIRLWDARSSQGLATLLGHTNRVRAVAFSPDGTMLASGSDDHTIRLWDVYSSKSLKVLKGHSNRVRSVAFSSDGRTLVSGSTDQTLGLWDVSSGKRIQSFEGHTHGLRSVAFSPDGTMLASGSDDQTIRIWEIASGACLQTLQGHTNHVWSLAFHPDGQVLASGSEDRTIRIWHVAGGQCRTTLQGHTSGIRTVAFSPDGNTFVSGGDDQTIRFWDIDSSHCLTTLHGYTNRVWSVAFSPAGQQLVSSSEDRYIRLWDIQSQRNIKSWCDEAHGVRTAVFSPDGHMLASGGEDHSVRLWDDSGHLLKMLPGHTHWLRCVIFSPDGKLLASGGEDHTIRIWDVSSGDCLKTLNDHTNSVRSMAFSPDGLTLASGSDDQTVRLWNVQSGDCLTVFTGHDGHVRAVAFHPAGQTLASGSEDYTVRIWDSKTGTCLKTLQGHMNRILSVAFSPDGGILASSSDDLTIRLWDLTTDQPCRVLQGHSGRVRTVAFSPNGDLLASSSDDGTLKLWSSEKGACLTTLISTQPYEGMNIAGVSGLTDTQKITLRVLGAVDAY